jgi:elongation factor Ts
VKITAAQVNELRKKTGAGMMDCKKALVEAEGDFNTAIDLLRKQGQKVAAKRSDRDAAEGIVLGKVSGNKAILLNLSCETDFVAKTVSWTSQTSYWI